MMHAQDRHNLLAMFAHAPMGIALLREPDHRLDYWNDLFTEFFPGAQAGVAVATALPALATHQVLGHLDSLYGTGEAYQGPVVPLATSDVPRYVTFTYQAYREQGQIVGVALFIQDVTAQELARQRAEEASQQLRRHQALLDQVLGQAPAALATFSGPQHRISFFNAQYQQLSGHRSVLGVPLAEAVPEADAQGFLTLLDRVYQTGEPYVGNAMPMQHLEANGETATHYVDFRYQPLRDQLTGQVQGILVFAVEVTAQVLARRQAAALQAELLAATQARETFYQVFAQTPAAICIQRGPAHRYEYVNAAYQHYFPGRELLGKTVLEAVPETEASGLLALLDHVYQTGETYYGYEVPVPLTQPDGSVRVEYVTFTYQAFREQGEIVGISTFAYDVAELVRARRAREQQQQLLATVFEQAPAGIWVVRGPEYVFEFINPVMNQIIGRTTEEALGRPYFEVLPELFGQGLPELFSRAWELGEPVFIEELPVRLVRHGTHEQGYFTFVFQPLRDEQDQVSRIACVAQEVTTQVLARQQVQHLNEQMSTTNQTLTRINADLDTFVYTASHDLRAPIANLQGLVDALRQELLAEPIAKAVVEHIFKLLNDSIQRLYTTIGHLTDIIKVHQPGTKQRETVAIARLVEDVQLDLAPLFREAGATLHVDTSACPLIEGSPKDLRSIVYNLVSNAVKYRAAARPPRVQVHTACDEQWVELRVQDNGLGLSLSQQEKLFGLFQRLHDHVEGSGVGLYSIKKLVDNAGGTITVDSELGVGSTFTVRLPA